MSPTEDPIINHREQLAQGALGALQKDFVVIGKTRVKGWHAWLLIGIAAGIAAGVVLVANRSGDFLTGEARGSDDEGISLEDPALGRLLELERRGAITGFGFFRPPTGEISQHILSGISEGDSVLLGVGHEITQYSLPEIVKEHYVPESISGYIVKLKRPPLAHVVQEFNEEIVALKQDLKRAKDDTVRQELKKKIEERKRARKEAITQQRALVRSEQDEAKRSIQALTASARVKKAFTNSLNGLLLDFDIDDVALLQNAGYELWPNRSVQALLSESVPMINADDVRLLKDPEGNVITGRGITIAIIDTGIDYTHPDLGGCLGQQCKVVGGYDVVNGDSDPMDDKGHGTHVAAIAAGNGALKGVAPEALLLAYKVLGADSRGFFDWTIEGIERAMDPNGDGDISDAADIINLSLGGPGDPDDPVSIAVDSAVRAGIVVVVAARLELFVP